MTKGIKLPGREGLWEEVEYLPPVEPHDTEIRLLGKWPGTENVLVFRRIHENPMPELRPGMWVSIPALSYQVLLIERGQTSDWRAWDNSRRHVIGIMTAEILRVEENNRTLWRREVR